MRVLKNITPQTSFFITGHTGFKGTWLALLLDRLGMSVSGYALPPLQDALFAQIPNEFTKLNTYADIRDGDSLRLAMLTAAPEVVIHLAAQPLVIDSYKRPNETFEVNVQGTVNVLEAATTTPSVRIILIVTTDKVYRNFNTEKRFVESDCLEGSDPYSCSKVGAEAAALAWQKMNEVNNGPKVLIARAGNVIGGGDLSPNRLLPDIVRATREKRRLEVRNPSFTRPWQHVLDPLFGYLSFVDFALTQSVPSALNFGPVAASMRVDEVVALAQKDFEFEMRLDGIQEHAHFEAKTLELDSTLARESLGWSPIWDQAESVRRTLAWWRMVLNREIEPLQACQSDLEAFLIQAQ